MRKAIGVLLALVAFAVGIPTQAQNGNQASVLSIVAGKHIARNYSTWRNAIHVAGGGSIAAGTSVSIPLRDPVVKLADGRTINPYFPNVRVTIGAGSTAETLAITSASGCSLGASPGSCSIVVTTVNAHGNSEPVVSGSVGLDEALLDAASGDTGNAAPSALFGGVVVLDPGWTVAGGKNTTITGGTFVWPNVAIEDDRAFAPQFWNAQLGATVLAAPATLTAVTALPSATPVGAFGTGTYHMCIAYVDVMGQEGPCSADFSEAGLATGSFIFSSPAASAGAVGYTIYIGLTGGGVTNLDYKVPLVIQPTVVGAVPVANGVCTLTTAETTTPACSMVNTTYGTLASTATVTVITLATSPVQPNTGIVSTTAITLPNAGGRTTVTYAPGSHLGTPGIPATFLAFPASGSAATTVPTVLGTVDLPPGFMNYLGRKIRVCGRAGITTGSTTTIVNIIFQWSAMGQDNAGLPVNIGRLAVTPATAFATTEMDNFCEDFITTVTSASVTGGSINTAEGFIATSGVAAAAAGQAAGGDALTGATGSLNLAEDARIDVVYTHTTGTFAPTLQNLTVTVLN